MKTTEIKTEIAKMEAQGMYVDGIKNLLHDALSGKKNSDWYWNATIESIAGAKEEFERIKKLDTAKIAKKPLKTIGAFNKNRTDCGKVLSQISFNAPAVFDARISEARQMLETASLSYYDLYASRAKEQLKEAAMFIAALKKDISEYTPEPSNDGGGDPEPETFEDAARRICAEWGEGNFDRQVVKVWQDDEGRIHIYGDAHNWCLQAKRRLIAAWKKFNETPEPSNEGGDSAPITVSFKVTDVKTLTRETQSYGCYRACGIRAEYRMAVNRQSQGLDFVAETGAGTFYRFICDAAYIADALPGVSFTADYGDIDITYTARVGKATIEVTNPDNPQEFVDAVRAAIAIESGEYGNCFCVAANEDGETSVSFKEGVVSEAGMAVAGFSPEDLPASFTVRPNRWNKATCSVEADTDGEVQSEYEECVNILHNALREWLTDKQGAGHPRDCAWSGGMRVHAV